jgi:DNA-binding protein HU-beta
VNITGFGNFTVKHRAERQGRNPATGETITIAAKYYAHFSAAKGLKDRVAE